MAVSIDFNICVNNACDTINFIETTGTYSTTNLTGWGTPNTPVGAVVSATLQATSPSGTITNISLITNGFPTSNPSLSFDISSLGYVDGKWDFTLYYYDGATYYTKRHVYYFYCTTKCCVEKLLSALDIEDCSCCDNKDINDYLYTKVLLDGLILAAKCQQEDNFTTIKTILDKICVNTGCITCN